MKERWKERLAEDQAMTDLERRLLNWVTDWDSKLMSRGEPPRDGIYCGVLYDAIEALAAARRQRMWTREEVIEILDAAHREGAATIKQRFLAGLPLTWEDRA